jgi:hypothetical protein
MAVPRPRAGMRLALLRVPFRPDGTIDEEAFDLLADQFLETLYGEAPQPTRRTLPTTPHDDR